jgi:hypothetical protein
LVAAVLTEECCFDFAHVWAKVEKEKGHGEPRPFFYVLLE